MKYKVSRLENSDNIRIAAVITGYDETLEDENNNVESVFNDYRAFHAEEGGDSWPLRADDENGEEYFQEGQEDPVQQAIDNIDENTITEYLEADPDDVLRINLETGELTLKPWQIGENRDGYIFIETGERDWRFNTVEELQKEFYSQYNLTK